MTNQLNFADAAAAALAPQNKAVPNAGGGTPQNRPSAKIWLNVGMNIPVQQEDGTVVEQFISIPMGIPFDTMEPMTARGNNPENNQRVEVGNMILEHFQKKCEALKPGETMAEPQLVCEFRRVQEQGVAGTAQAGNENPLASSFIQLVK